MRADDEIVFVAVRAAEGGWTARALEADIFTEADDEVELAEDGARRHKVPL